MDSAGFNDDCAKNNLGHTLDDYSERNQEN